MCTTDLCKTPRARAVLDEAHIGDIRGALGTIRQHDIAPRRGWWTRLRTLLAILGPGLIVMAGDNDAGAFDTYSQAGQDYGTSLLWTMLLLVPVLYVNQEMVLRLGTVTGVGHARLILERFGRFCGAFSVIDLFLLNALTIVTEFIGISLALHYLGLPRELGVIASAAIIIAAAGTGDFRRFERFSLLLVFGSLLLIPVFIWVHPPIGEIAHGLAVPQLPADGKASEVILLIIAIVGTTVAPWQLFFQQSYVIDKRITPRFMRYERADLCIGIVLVIVGAVAIMAFAAATFAGRPEFGNFQDAGAVAAGLGKYVGHAAGIFFAVALIDASVIGAMAVSLSTAYAIGDVLSLRHSLHCKPKEAKAFYAVYGGLVTLAAALVLTPGTPLGLLTNAVQALAGVLLPSATVFLLLLCNDGAVLGWGSMALVADGLHMSTHAGALVIAAFAYDYARRHAHDERFAFGTGKLGDLAAFTSAIVLAMIALLIGYESVERLIHPVAIAFDEAIPLAAIGLAVNLLSAWLLHEGDGHVVDAVHEQDGSHHQHRHHHDDHNLRAAYIHVVADAAVSVLALIGLTAGRELGWVWMDPVMGIVGMLVIANWSRNLVRISGALLLDMRPEGRVAAEIAQRLEAGSDDRVSDLHLWRVGPGHNTAVVSLVSDRPDPPATYNERLASIAGLSHVTIEVQTCPGKHSR